MNPGQHTDSNKYSKPFTSRAINYPLVLSLLILACFCIIANYYYLQDFKPNIAGWSDENLVYYAQRGVELTHYTGDILHDSFQTSYPWLTSVFWAPTLLYKWLGIPPVHSAILVTAAKIWLLTFASYFLAYGLLKKPLISLVVAISVVSSDVISLNLGFFGFLPHIPYPSDLAYPFVLISLYCLYQKKISSALMLILFTTTIHPSIGAMGYFLVVATILGDYKSFSKRQLFFSILTALPVIILAVAPSLNLLSEIPENMRETPEIIYKKVNNGHGSLWEHSGNQWWKLLNGSALKLGLLLIPVSLSALLKDSAPAKVLKSAFLASVALVILGVLAKWTCIALMDSRWLKIALNFHLLFMTRASVFSLIIAQIIIVCYLLTRMSDELAIVRVAAWLALLLTVNLHLKGLYLNISSATLFTSIVLCVVLIYGELKKNEVEIVRWLDILLALAVFISFIFVSYEIFSNVDPSYENSRLLKLWIFVMSCWVLFLTLAQTFKSHFNLTPVVYLLLSVTALAITFGCVDKWHDSVYEIIVFPSCLALPFIISATDIARLFKKEYITKLLNALPAIVLLLICVSVGIRASMENVLPEERIYRQDFYEASMWAKNNTREKDSFLILTELGGFRTFSKRGAIMIFDEYLSLIFVNDLRFNQYFDKINDYLDAKYPGLDRDNILIDLDIQDMKWFADYTGASYVLAPNSLSYQLPIAFKNSSLTIYKMP